MGFFVWVFVCFVFLFVLFFWCSMATNVGMFRGGGGDI